MVVSDKSVRRPRLTQATRRHIWLPARLMWGDARASVLDPIILGQALHRNYNPYNRQRQNQQRAMDQSRPGSSEPPLRKRPRQPQERSVDGRQVDRGPREVSPIYTDICASIHIKTAFRTS